MVGRNVTVLLFTTLAVVTAVVNPHGPTVVLDFTHCIDNLVEKNFKDPGDLIFAMTNNASTSVSRIRAELLTRIHKKVKFTVEVKSPQTEVDVCDSYGEKLEVSHAFRLADTFEARPLGDYFIILIDTYEDFPYLASRIMRSRAWNPSAKFIILLYNFAENKINNQHVEKILSCFFKYNAINIAVIVPQANNIRNAIIYGWQPYDPPKYCGYFNETARDRLFVENICEKGGLKYRRGVFEDRIPIDMNGCVLYIIALERQPFVSRDPKDANIEKILIDECVKRYKLVTNYEIINGFRGERSEEDHGEWSGALKELTTKKGQLLLGGIFPDFDVHEDFECSRPYLADSYAWVVPKAYQSPPWIALLIIFNNIVWCSVIGAFSFCAIFWRVLGQLSGDAPYHRSIGHCFLNAWICSLGFCAYLRPTKPSLRLFFIFFNIYCILVVTGYQTKLIDVLKNPTFEYQIKTVEELVESGLKFGGFEELHDLFSNSTDPFDSFVSEHWTDVDDIYSAMLDVAVHRNFSLLCSRLELAYISAVVPDLIDSAGNFKYYAFDMNTFSVPVEMVALRGFGLMDKISATLSLFQQAGINEALRRRFKTFNNRRREKLLRSLIQEKSEIKSLSALHLEGGFLILALGYVSGVLVLGLEILSNTDFIKRKYSRFNKHIRK